MAVTCTPNRSEMFDVSAVRVSPTCASPLTCTGQVAGPATIVAGLTDRRRPPAVHTEPVSSQDSDGLSEIITRSSDARLDLDFPEVAPLVHRLRPGHPASPHLHAVVPGTPPRPVAISSLNAILKLNAVSPSCCDGRPWKLAVRVGPDTVAAGLL